MSHRKPAFKSKPLTFIMRDAYRQELYRLSEELVNLAEFAEDCEDGMSPELPDMKVPFSPALVEFLQTRNGQQVVANWAKNNRIFETYPSLRHHSGFMSVDECRPELVKASQKLISLERQLCRALGVEPTGTFTVAHVPAEVQHGRRL